MQNPLYFLEPTPATRSSFFLSLQRLPRWLYGVIGFVVFLALSTGLAVFVVGPLANTIIFTSDKTVNGALQLMVTFSPYWLMLFVYAIAVRSFRGTGFTAHHAIRHLLIGLAIGLVFNLAASVGVGLVTGNVTVNAHVLSDPAFWVGFAVWLAASFIQGGGEEVLFRGLMPRFLGRTLSAGMVTFVSTFTFAVAHSFVPNVVVILIFSLICGALFGLVEILTNSAWLTVGFHTTFNFVALYLATPASGLFTLKADALTIITTLGLPLVAAIVLLLVLNKRRPGWFRERLAAPAAAESRAPAVETV